ncbi:MAG: hypothetical protein ACRELX_01180 [Longimicrobiales bacterium]
MSLIETRRERRWSAGGPTRPPSLWRLLAALVLVVFMIWYLSQLGGG